jgi:hypothetical protein
MGEVTELREFLTTAQNQMRSIERAAEPEEAAQDSSGQFSYSLRQPATNTTSAVNMSAIREGHTANLRESGQAEGQESLNSNNMDLF